jgi:hypothetical protein
MLARGAWEAALRDRPDPAEAWQLLSRLDAALATASDEGRRAWVEAGASVLVPLLDEEIAAAEAGGRDPCDTGTLVLLVGAKHLAAHLPASTGQRLLAHLERHVAAESAAGCYDELDYPYGTPDPALELAHALATGGEPARAEAQLTERDGRFAQFLNDEELAEAAQTLAAFEPARRDAWWPKLQRWARATDAESGAPSFHRTEIAWLLAVLPEDGLDRELDGRIDRTLGAAALHALVTHALPSARLRAAARTSLVECITADADGLARPDATDFERMWHRTALRAGAAAAAHVAPELTAAQHDAVADAAAVWSRRVADAERAAALSHLPIAIALAPAWRRAIAPALVVMRRLPAEHVATHPGWENLFTPKGVDGVLDRLLK